MNAARNDAPLAAALVEPSHVAGIDAPVGPSHVAGIDAPVGPSHVAGIAAPALAWRAMELLAVVARSEPPNVTERQDGQSVPAPALHWSRSTVRLPESRDRREAP